MKKVLLLVCVVITIMLASCGEPEKTMYTKEELYDAIAKAEERAYKDGYAEGEHDAEGEFESNAREYLDAAYEAGYEHGYEIGYDEGYDDAKDGKRPYDSDDLPRIKKD